MARIELPEHPTDEERDAFLRGLHTCIDDNHKEQMAATGRFKLDGRINVLGLGAVLVTLGGMAWGGATWLTRVDASLNTLAQVISDQKASDAKLDQMYTDLQVIKATEQANADALMGTQPPTPRRRRPAP